MRRSSRVWRFMVAVSLVLPALLGPIPREPQTAEAQGLGGVLMVGRIFGGMRGRNRVYGDANAYIEQRQEYHDRLRETAREQLREREVGGLRRSQLAAYIKVVALIEAERQGMIDFAEGEKRAARQEFLDTVEDVIVDRILASGAAQRALGALKDGIDSVDDVIEEGLEKITGGEGALEEVARAREIATRAGQVAALVGGEKGAKISQAMGRVVEVTSAPTAEIEAGLEQVQEEIAPVRDEVDELQNRGNAPTAKDVAKPVVVNALPGGGSESALEAIARVLGGKVGREDADFRERARAALTGQFLARCAAIGENYREAVSQLEGAAAGEAMSDEEAAAPCNAIDLEGIAEEVEATQRAEPTLAPEALDADEPTVVLSSYSKSRSACEATAGLSGIDCDVLVNIDVVVGGLEDQGRLECQGRGPVDPLGERVVEPPGGAFNFDKLHENLSTSAFEGADRSFASCRLIVEGEVVSQDAVDAEFPWTDEETGEEAPQGTLEITSYSIEGGSLSLTAAYELDKGEGEVICQRAGATERGPGTSVGTPSGQATIIVDITDEHGEVLTEKEVEQYVNCALFAGGVPIDQASP